MTTPGVATVTGAVGDIHRFIAGTSGATILVLHGTGGNENDLVPLAARIAPGANLLAPRGPVLEHGMPRFFRRLAPGVFDEVDLRRRTAELATFVRRCTDRYAFDPSRVMALGYSNGANIAASLLLTDPRLLRGAVLLRGQLPFEPAVVPRLAGQCVYLVAGRQDPYVTAHQVERLAEVVRDGGADVTLAWSDAGHGLTTEEIGLASEWLRTQPI